MRQPRLSNPLAPYEHDIAGFAEHVLGIKVNPGQRRFFAAVEKQRSRWIARWLTIMLASGNRAGKTLALAIIIIHSCIYKTNLQSTWIEMSAERAGAKKAKAEYHAYHFGIAHEVADLVFNEIVRILGAVHPAQLNGCPLTANGEVATWDVKEYGDFRWIQFVNGSQVHFRTTGEKALGTLGKDMHLLTFDEAGLDPKLDFLVDEVFDFRRLGTGGQLIMVSTPSEDLGVQFADMWAMGDPNNPDKSASHFSLRMSTRENIGYGLTQEMFDILTEGFDKRKMDQNVEGIFIQARAAYFNGWKVDACFIADLPERAPARKGLAYLQGVDPAKTQDSAWSVVLAVVSNPAKPEEPYLVGVRAEQKSGQKSADSIVALAADAHNAYDVARLGSRCYTAIDATGFGGKLFRELLEREVPSLTNVEFGGTIQKKRKLLGDLRTIIDSGRLLLPREGIWMKVRRQLLGYKLDDRGIEQDACMALVCAVYLLRLAPAEGKASIRFDLGAGGS